MKKWMTTAAVLLAVLLMVTGCSGSAQTETTTTTAASVQGVPSTGILSQFTSQDLVSGETIDQELLKKYELTMVCVWSTTCGYCIQEMPGLAELAVEYEPKGVKILGFVGDVINSDGSISDSQMKTARDIVNTTGADYPHMIPTPDLFGILNQISAVPTTFFVDSEGKQVGYAYSQAMGKAGWSSIIEKMLVEVRK